MPKDYIHLILNGTKNGNIYRTCKRSLGPRKFRQKSIYLKKVTLLYFGIEAEEVMTERVHHKKLRLKSRYKVQIEIKNTVDT